MVWGSVAMWTSQCVVTGGDLQRNRVLRDVVETCSALSSASGYARPWGWAP